MTKHRKCKNCGFNLIHGLDIWEHKLKSRHCKKAEPEDVIKK